MNKKIRLLICVLFFSALVFAVAAACDGKEESGDHTLAFVTNTDESFDPITAREGEDISAQLPDFNDTEAYYFGGWYTTEDLSGESVSLPQTMPAADATYYARWYVTYSVEKYLQKTDLSGYETESAESLSGEVNKGAALPTRVTNFLATDPEGFTLFTGDDPGAARKLTLNEKDNALKMYYDRKEYSVIYDKNLPAGTAVQGEMSAEFPVYGTEHALSENRFSAEGYRFAGWSLDPEGGELVESVNITNQVKVYAIWDKALTDAFGGSDYVYLSHAEAGVAYLDRPALGEKKGIYSESASVFTFDQGNGTLSGKVLGEYFFYFKDLWQNTFDGADGATLELKADGSAVLAEGGDPVNGSYSIDMDSGYFVFESNGVERLFVFTTDGEAFTFSFSGSEQGWYAFQTEDGFDYELLFLDGFGRMSVYAISPDSPEFDPFFDVYSGTYALDDEGIYVAEYVWGAYGSTFPFKLNFSDGKELDGIKLKGTFILGDYRGTFTDIDEGYNTLYLDGFGNGTYGWSYDLREGTYTIEQESWSVDNYPTPGLYTVSVVAFTFEDQSVTRFAIYQYNDEEGLYIEVSEFYGRYEFEVAPESIYPGSRGDVAFLYFSGYSSYPDGSFNDGAIWFGNYDPKYSVSGYTDGDLPLYSWRDDGSVFATDKPNTYRYVSVWENVSFEFEITEDKKIRWHVADEDVVFYNADGEKLYVDTFGVGRYEHDGKVDEVPFGYNAFFRSDSLEVETEESFEYLLLYTFQIGNEYRSFTCTAPITEVGFGGELNNLKEVDFVAFVGNVGLLIAYKDGTGTVGLDMSLAGGIGYWFAITGTIGNGSAADVWYFRADGTAPEDDESARYVFELLGNLDFKLAEGEDGIYDCLMADGIVYNVSCPLGSLVTDGYGSAVFTPAGGNSYACTYSWQGDALYLLCEGDSDPLDWYLTISEDENSFAFAGKEAGIFFTFNEYDEPDYNNLLIFNGMGQVVGAYDGSELEGSYTATGDSFTLNGVLFSEFKIVFTYQGDDEVSELHVIVGLISSDLHVGYLYFRDDSAVGYFTVVNEAGEEVGTLSSDGYLSAVYESADGRIFGEMHVGAFAESARTNRYGERDFVLNASGSTVVFFDEEGNEYVFDIQKNTSNVVLRTLEFGVFASYAEGEAGDGLLKLNGGGNAVLTDGNGNETAVFYELYPALDRGFRLFNKDGETIFFFNIALVNNEEQDSDDSYGYLYVYRLYDENADGVYINGDWTVLILNGFGDAFYIDKYGVQTYYEAIPVDGSSVLLRASNGGANKFVSLGDDTFEIADRAFIVSEEGTLLAYNGEGGSIALPDEVIRIAKGVFDGVELTHVDFNNVEVIEAGVFAGQRIDGVDAPKLRIIGERAFERIDYYNFETVNVPSVTQIGEAAFIGCSYLKFVTLGAIEYVGEQAFAASGYAYGSFMVDMRAAENAAEVEIDSTAFLALNAETFRVLVKDIATVNAVIQCDGWPTKAIENLSLWFDPDPYAGSDYLFSVTEGAIFELYEGIATKAVADENGETLLTVAGLYAKNVDTISFYSKQGTLFATTPTAANASAAYSIAISEGFAFSKTDYGEVHSLTTSDGTVEFSANVSCSSSSTAYLSRYKVTVSDVKVTIGENSSVGADAMFDTARGVLEFCLTTADEVAERYAVRFTSSAECTLEKLGTQKTITTEGDGPIVTFLVDELGAPVQLVSLKQYAYGDPVAVFFCKIEGNVFTVQYEAAYNRNDTVKLTYDAESEKITMEPVECVFNASNLYMDGLWGAVVLVFDADLKITEVRSFSIGEYNAGKEQKIVETVLNDDGSATFTLANGDRYTVTVSQDGGYYEVNIAKND